MEPKGKGMKENAPRIEKYVIKEQQDELLCSNKDGAISMQIEGSARSKGTPI